MEGESEMVLVNEVWNLMLTVRRGRIRLPAKQLDQEDPDGHVGIIMPSSCEL